MKQLEVARAGMTSPEMQYVAEEEGVDPEIIRDGIARGTIVILAGLRRTHARPTGIGAGLRTKVNANIGTSPDKVNLENERAKLLAAVESRADTVMDLSTGGDLWEIRRMVVENSSVPVGSVPIYEAAVRMSRRRKRVVDMTEDDLFAAVEAHLEDGIDFITVHCGVTLAAIARLRRQSRITDVVSRGGAFLARWMAYHERENPLYEQYDRLLEMAKVYDAVLSLGDGLRPGCLADATDRSQIEELLTLGELVDRARRAGVQVMVEGPGHIPLHEIEMNVRLEKKLCGEAPFYVLGPLVADCAPGYDHITGAIGGAIAAVAGADFLCYVTPTEHLGLPDVEDVHQGVLAARIAAHAGDLAKGVSGAQTLDDRVSRARKAFDWESMIALSLDPQGARAIRERCGASDDEHKCTMCGEFCAMRGG